MGQAGPLAGRGSLGSPMNYAIVTVVIVTVNCASVTWALQHPQSIDMQLLLGKQPHN